MSIYFVFLFVKPIAFAIVDMELSEFLKPALYIKVARIFIDAGTMVSNGRKEFDSKQKQSEKGIVRTVAVKLRQLTMNKDRLAEMTSFI